ncbi:unnamed protein product [Phaedon cochleariae]|uniref:Sm domain-containing protein n=1 Tax=Phaedon cochleariae TaxID=80249 RepID=A0A9P0GV87_PHACE|nr:unnamed protein product [Phaedon cochleariae]
MEELKTDIPDGISDNVDSELSEDTTPENELEPMKKQDQPLNMTSGAVQLRSWLNKSFRVEMTDGRVLIGIFLCTDRDANIILGSCSEYLPSDGKGGSSNEEPRMLGLVMIPGKHIVTIHIDPSEYNTGMKAPLKEESDPVDVT